MSTQPVTYKRWYEQPEILAIFMKNVRDAMCVVNNGEEASQNVLTKFKRLLYKPYLHNTRSDVHMHAGKAIEDEATEHMEMCDCLLDEEQLDELSFKRDPFFLDEKSCEDMRRRMDRQDHIAEYQDCHFQIAMRLNEKATRMYTEMRRLSNLTRGAKRDIEKMLHRKIEPKRNEVADLSDNCPDCMSSLEAKPRKRAHSDTGSARMRKEERPAKKRRKTI
ncbi:hypothetical protein CERSUDRAFT_90055 [Gelatoporia subvermispora B]|uniref:Uncharacterized protein n=1 Tax=Ceriporiopsis subvermispora (strain B) TaxID=914234 RepID=M2RRI7_CERS8|nr:hypothetical protein CERSUDRAFT_90055 [Gelatoporia subvermispora B]